MLNTKKILAVDYRLAPEHPFPAALQDASHAFHHLTDPQGVGFDPKNVTAAGDSAGGGLTIALMMYQRDHGLPMPSKAFLLSVSFFVLLVFSGNPLFHLIVRFPFFRFAVFRSACERN